MIQFVQEPPSGEPVFFFGYFSLSHFLWDVFVIKW